MMMFFDEFKEEVLRIAGDLLGRKLITRIIPAPEGQREYIMEYLPPDYAPHMDNAKPMVNLKALKAVYDDGMEPLVAAAALKEMFGLSLDMTERHKVPEYEEVKQYLMAILMKGDYPEYLKTVPHRMLCDMAIIYRLLIFMDGEFLGSVAVTNDMLREWDITQEELDRDAMENATYTVPAFLQNMPLLLEMCRVPDNGQDLPDMSMYVVGNNIGAYGASAILYPGLLDDVAEALGGEIIIIPSSIHDIICVRNAGQFKMNELTGTLYNINDVWHHSSENLSDHIYAYRQGGQMEIIA